MSRCHQISGPIQVKRESTPLPLSGLFTMFYAASLPLPICQQEEKEDKQR